MSRNAWNSTIPVDAAQGGTGLTTITDHAVMVGSAAGAVTPVAMNTNGMVLIGSNGADPVAAVITAGSGITVTNGAGSIAIASSSSNYAIQQVYANTTALIDITTGMPNDDTIPQNTEGGEVLTCAITPTNASNYLLIEFNSSLGVSDAGNWAVGALFQDATAGALAAELIGHYNGYYTNGNLKYRMVAGTTSATTFKIRIGLNASGHIYINGIPTGSRFAGGVANTTLVITEYKV